VASDKKRFIIKCKSDGCGFRVRATKHANKTSSITVFDLHTCSPVTHYKSKQSQSVAYLAPHHRASVIDNRNITVAQIRSNERLQHGNNVSYKQAYRTVQTIRKEIDGNEAEGFAKFPAYVQAFLDADVDNYCELKTAEDGKFEAAFFAPCGMRYAHLYMRRFIGFDSTHTRSRYCMMLLICARIDANDQVLPLAWALVLIKNKKWWFWFMDNLHDAFDMLQRESDKYVFISDRDKGLDPVIKQRFPYVKQSFCCQHLCDNIVAAYGAKCKALFWPIAQAKTKQAFESALAELRACNTSAADYLDSI
jgi:hypothetical protein